MIKICGYPVYCRCSEEQLSVVSFAGTLRDLSYLIPRRRLTTGSRICLMRANPDPVSTSNRRMAIIPEFNRTVKSIISLGTEINFQRNVIYSKDGKGENKSMGVFFRN